MYGDLIKALDSSSVSEPEIKIIDEYDDLYIINKQLELFGYYYSSHPASKYPNVMKAKDIRNNFDKLVNVVVLVDKIRTIKTKNNDDMAFVTGSDETGIMDLVVFPRSINELKDIKIGDLILVNGRVERRNDLFQIVIRQIKKQ